MGSRRGHEKVNWTKESNPKAGTTHKRKKFEREGANPGKFVTKEPILKKQLRANPLY